MKTMWEDDRVYEYASERRHDKLLYVLYGLTFFGVIDLLIIAWFMCWI